MAMIKCPECGRMISDMASCCPNCGYPIAKNVNNGVVQIKLGMFNSTQSASISDNDRILWSGRTGQIAEFKLDRPTNVQIKYQMGMLDHAGACEGIIDPNKSKKWMVIAQPGFFKMKLTLEPVDSL